MCQFYPNLFPPEVDRDERENVLAAASRKRLLDTIARILRILRIHEKERKRENNAIRLTWLRVSSLLRDGHRNERHTTSALPPDPLTRSKPFRVKIVCLVLLVRRRRRSSIRAHHSHGKHDFNDDTDMLFVVVFFLARVSFPGRSSLCLGARTRRESNQ